MRYAFSFVAGLLIAMIPAFAAADGAVSTATRNFDIKMPCNQPDRTTEADGKLTLTCDTGDRGYMFVAEVADDTVTADALYDSVASNLISTLRGKLRNSAPITINGLSGREILIEGAGRIIRIRGFVAGEMFFVLSYMGEPGTENDQPVTDFLGSFKLK
jgi:hypothetical protein